MQLEREAKLLTISASTTMHFKTLYGSLGDFMHLMLPKQNCLEKHWCKPQVNRPVSFDIKLKKQIMGVGVLAQLDWN